jgi:cytochrome c oxidase subunit II
VMLQGLFAAPIPLFPEQASSIAWEVDALYFYLIGVSVVFGLGIALAIVFFAIRFKRKAKDEVPGEIEGSTILEVAWSVIPFLLTIVMFVWGADIFFKINRPPDNAMEVSVVGKRWMWKLQHITGQREINELHVPVGVPVKLTLTSEDVIHSFFVPAFRIKRDAVPGRYSTLWFKATKPGNFHLFCAEYCGTEHSGMIGKVVVMEQGAYQQWLAGGPPVQDPVAAGERLFTDLNCITCHKAEDTGRGPVLVGLYGRTQKLASGESITVDDSYIRESIMTPSARVVAGYQPVMPTYQGQVSEENILALIAYIQSIASKGPS